MNESILITIRKLLVSQADDDCFDQELMMYINTTFPRLLQLGIGPETGFRIIDESMRWSDYVQNPIYLDFVISFIHLKTKLLFDPPANGTLVKIIEDQISELEFGITCAIDEEKSKIKEEQND